MPRAVQIESPYDTLYYYRMYHLIMEIHRNDTLISKTVMEEKSDTLFSPGGQVASVHESPLFGNTEKYTDYYTNGKVRSRYECFDRDGMGGTTSEFSYYDSIGNLDSVISNKDYMPPGSQDHLSVCGVVTYRYFKNGKLYLVKKYDEHYEGCYRCPCGTWEYYDTNGKLLKKDRFKNCGDGKTDCEDMCQ